jgi:hypothetical protein
MSSDTKIAQEIEALYSRAKKGEDLFSSELQIVLKHKLGRVEKPLVDEFENIRARFLTKKKGLDERMMRGSLKGAKYASAVNALISQELLKPLFKLLGKERYEKVFGTPSTRIAVVDPAIAKDLPG